VREDRAALEFKGAFACVGVHDEVCAEDVGGHEVGRELMRLNGMSSTSPSADQEGLA
jgi:hypothetical protein